MKFKRFNQRNNVSISNRETLSNCLGLLSLTFLTLSAFFLASEKANAAPNVVSPDLKVVTSAIVDRPIETVNRPTDSTSVTVNPLPETSSKDKVISWKDLSWKDEQKVFKLARLLHIYIIPKELIPILLQNWNIPEDLAFIHTEISKISKIQTVKLPEIQPETKIRRIELQPGKTVIQNGKISSYEPVKLSEIQSGTKIRRIELQPGKTVIQNGKILSYEPVKLSEIQSGTKIRRIELQPGKISNYEQDINLELELGRPSSKSNTSRNNRNY